MPDRLSRIGGGLWLIVFLLYVDKKGIPYTTDDVCVWLFTALVAVSLGDLFRSGPRILRDWLGLLAVLFFYNLLRGYAHNTPWSPHYSFQFDLDKLLGGGKTWTERLQDWLFHPHHLYFYDYISLFVYLSHFVVSFIIMAVLWKRNYERFRRYLYSYLFLTFLGFVTFVFYPAQPPWMVSETGRMEPVVRIVPFVLERVHLHLAAAIFLKGSAYDNDIAAFPSLHAAYPMLICLFFWPTSRWSTRVLLVAYPAVMAFALVYGAEHFITDILFGYLYTVVALVGVRHVFDWLESRTPTDHSAGPELVHPVS